MLSLAHTVKAGTLERYRQFYTPPPLTPPFKVDKGTSIAASRAGRRFRVLCGSDGTDSRWVSISVLDGGLHGPLLTQGKKHRRWGHESLTSSMDPTLTGVDPSVPLL